MLVRIFVSSHCLDMEAERHCLVGTVLPKLRRWAERRAVEVELVDGCAGPGGGATDKDDAGALRANLPAIDACRPFFLGLLGQRYGLPIDPLPDEIADLYPELLLYEGRSRLELEWRHAMGTAPGEGTGILFFARAPDFPDAVSPGFRERYSAEDPTAAARVAALRESIREAGWPLIEYGCAWDPERGKVCRLERFEDAVIRALRDAIVEWQAAREDRNNRSANTGRGEGSPGEFTRIFAAPAVGAAPIPPPVAKPIEHYEPVPEYEKVQFTVYRPRVVRPAEWYPMLAYAHRKERRPDAPEDEPDPVDQVRALAAQALGRRAREFRDTTTDSTHPIPREGEITFLPAVPGIEFSPERRVFRWIDDVHQEEFRLRASPEIDGTTANGHLLVYHGGILIAQVGLAIRVSRHPLRLATDPNVLTVARAYRKIFASYSHRDAEIVRQFEAFARSLGDDYLRDVVGLRAGEVWDERIARMIEEADVFQLFWSSNSMKSPYVQREWEHALALDRPFFVRPTYWEEPLPESPGPPPLPPERLRRLHFHRVMTLDALPPPPDQPMAATGEYTRIISAPSFPAAPAPRHPARSLRVESPAHSSPRRWPLIVGLLVVLLLALTLVLYVALRPG